MKSFSLDLRERLVAGRQRGHCAAELARSLGLSKRSVERYWKRYLEEGSPQAKGRGG